MPSAQILFSKREIHGRVFRDTLFEAAAAEVLGWAKRAPTLLVGAASTNYARTGKPNGTALHDLGLACATLVLQATQEGLSVHGMAGFDAARAKTELKMPADWQAVAMWAIGYPGALASLSEPLRARELAPRTRRPLSQTVFGAAADVAYPLT